MERSKRREARRQRLEDLKRKMEEDEVAVGGEQRDDGRDLAAGGYLGRTAFADRCQQGQHLADLYPQGPLTGGADEHVVAMVGGERPGAEDIGGEDAAALRQGGVDEASTGAAPSVGED